MCSNVFIISKIKFLCNHGQGLFRKINEQTYKFKTNQIRHKEHHNQLTSNVSQLINPPKS